MTDPTTPFARVKIRTGALVFCGADVALIRRDRPAGSHDTPPGGNPDGTSEPGVIEWVHYRDAEDLPLFPLIGSAISALPAPGAPPGDRLLLPVTDANYTWV
ncbi:hypothetical protein ABGB18_05555 [Nonomuraea sp. B12E4]|uniref:hypothetical protein n=1 Tax=Nonomuraea sp. B12E4 TaxID=3153564 RepID=UPI00325EB180